METRECRTCGGVYTDAGPDGVRYFHACPPLSLEELAAAVAAGTVRLRPGEDVEAAMARRVWPRPQARDENIDRQKAREVRARDGTRAIGTTDDDLMKAPGRGITPRPDLDDEEPRA